MSAEQRTPDAMTNGLRVGEWLVDPALDEISRGSEVIKLEPRTMRLLMRLAEAPGQVVSSQQLLDSVWSGVVVGPASVYQAVWQLRKLLGDTDTTSTYIATVSRKGYRLTAPVERIAPAHPPSDDQPIDAPPPAPIRSEAAVGMEGRPSRRYFWMVATAASAAVAILVIATLQNRREIDTQTTVVRAPTPVAASAIAVLPFRASRDEAGQLLAESVTDLMYRRLVAIKGLPVIANAATQLMTDVELNSREIGRKLHARYLLQGSISRAGDQLHMETALVDAASGEQLWSTVFDRPVADMTAMREDITQRVVDALHVPPAPNDAAAARAPIDLDTYQLYRQGTRLMSANATLADAEKAAALFLRATALDPDFALGYLDLGQALMYAADIRGGLDGMVNSETSTDARKAITHALELDPALAEAWVALGRLEKDPVKAEELYRKGMQLAPGYTVGSMFFADFLSSQGRVGEAIAVIERARQLDPLSPTLSWLQAGYLMDSRSDVAGSDKLLQEALATDPDFDPALNALAVNQWMWKGEFAEAVRTLEQTLDPDDGRRAMGAWMYLDMDDLPAALNTWYGTQPPPDHSLMVLEMYRRNPRGAAELARRVLAGSSLGLFGIAATSIRDEAVATGDYASALQLLDSVQASRSWTAQNPNRDFALVYAHVLILAGQTQRGMKLAKALLVSIDADEVGRPKHWFARQRADLFAMMGDDKRALEELAASQQLNHWTNWWYTGEVDPVYARLRSNPRFQALAEKAKKHRAEQRALLEEMRRKGEVPQQDRTGTRSAAAG